MAEILITGIEMPRGNNVLVVDSFGTITKVNRWTGKVEATDPFSVKAVALPQHGRLIDATELEASDAIIVGEEAWNMVHNAPTIIEANN